MAVTVQSPIVPRYLYRYRSLRDEDMLDREIEALRKHYIYLSKFSEMNDPMEGLYSPESSTSGETLEKAALSNIRGGKAGTGIACFTETKDHSLMWAHYAGNYSGICVRYVCDSLRKNLPSDMKLVRMAYNDSPPLIGSDDAVVPTDAAIRILSQKKSDWAYEREWRVLGEVGPRDIGKQAVDAVFFGIRIKNPHRQKINNNIRTAGIKTFEMALDGYRHRFGPANDHAKKYSDSDL